MLLGCLLKVWGEVGGCRGQGGGPEGRVGQAGEVGVPGGLCRGDPRAGEVRVAGGPGALPPWSRGPGVAELIYFTRVLASWPDHQDPCSSIRLFNKASFGI